MKDLVLLHGWGMSRGAFRELAEPLGGHLAVVAMDLPGYGGAEAPRPYTLAALASDVAARAPARCVVLGWSLGALVALAWAAGAPTQVEALVLVGATPCFVRKADWPHALDAEVLGSFAQALSSDRARALRRFVALVAHGDAEPKPVARVLQSAAVGSGGASEEVLQAGLRILLESDLRPLLPRIGQRALIVHGERDQLAPIAAGTYMAATLPHAQMETIEGAAHAPFVTDPERFAQRIAHFVYG